MRLLLFAAALGLTAPAANAADRSCTPAGQIDVYGLASTTDDLARVAELSGAVVSSSRLVRRGGDRTEAVCAEVSFPWPPFARPFGVAPREGDSGRAVRALPFQLASTFNSAYPSGDNDGLQWAGRGVSQLASFGATLRWRALSLAIAPEATWSENRSFELVPTGRSGSVRFGNPYYGDAIDLPQRFGAGHYATWGPGQSYLRLDYWNIAAGISSENLWIGPGIRNSILMSSSGPGFPHAFLGTSRPADIWIGNAEALVYYGRLERSRYIAGGGHPLISGIALTYEPRWVPGLYFGLHRYFVQPWDGLTLRDYLAILQPFPKKSLATSSNPTGDNPRDNQIVSAFARWVFPEAGLELYGEFAREDHPLSLATFVRDPDRSHAYLLGLQKVFRTGSRLVRFQAEVTELQDMAGFASRYPVAVYYVHGNDLSLTNEGQLLGAWIGPGADSQSVALDVFHAGGRIGGYVERVRREEAYYWAVVDPAGTVISHDVELAVGFRQALAAGPLEIAWDAAAAYRWNRDFIRDEWNLRVQLWLAVPFR